VQYPRKGLLANGAELEVVLGPLRDGQGQRDLRGPAQLLEILQDCPLAAHRHDVRHPFGVAAVGEGPGRLLAFLSLGHLQELDGTGKTALVDRVADLQAAAGLEADIHEAGRCLLGGPCQPLDRPPGARAKLGQRLVVERSIPPALGHPVEPFDLLGGREGHRGTEEEGQALGQDGLSRSLEHGCPVRV
jgi:hypothetical protein